MGRVDVTVEISNLDGTRSRELTAMVDTGATHTLIPASILIDLGIPVERTSVFKRADGRRVEYGRGIARIRFNGFSDITGVVFGDESATPLIGVVTLEQLELAVDPVGGTLIPLELTL